MATIWKAIQIGHQVQYMCSGIGELSKKKKNVSHFHSITFMILTLMWYSSLYNSHISWLIVGYRGDGQSHPWPGPDPGWHWTGSGQVPSNVWAVHEHGSATGDHKVIIQVGWLDSLPWCTHQCKPCFGMKFLFTGITEGYINKFTCTCMCKFPANHT